MSLTVSTSIPRTGSTGGGAPFLSAKVGGVSPLPLKVGGPKPPLPPLYLRPCKRSCTQQWHFQDLQQESAGGSHNSFNHTHAHNLYH